MRTELPTLGIGLTYFSAVEPVIEQCPELVDVIEVEPQTIWFKTKDPQEPYKISTEALDHIAQLPGRKLVHSVGVPIGGTASPHPAQCELLNRTISRLQAPWASEHLGFNSTDNFNTGFFLPPRQTSEGVRSAVSSIQKLKQSLTVPVAIETGVNYLRPRSDEMPDGEFIKTVVETADCGILLDLHNIYANGLNGRQSFKEFLSLIPLERVWEIHLAGGMELEGYWLDAHSGAIPDPLFDLAKEIVPALPNLKAMIFEIFPSFVPVVGISLVAKQLERLRELWDSRLSTSSDVISLKLAQAPHQQAPHQKETISQISPTTWEYTLGKLVIGQPIESDFAHELAQDPAIRVVKHLIQEFRASMVVGTYRLTSRLIMLAIGPDSFRIILEDFWSKKSPEQFSSAEGDNFASYLESIDLRIPQLAKVLEFERAVQATLIDESARVVTFDADPFPLLRALTEGRLPEMAGQLGRYEIEIVPDSTFGYGRDDVQQAGFHFH